MGKVVPYLKLFLSIFYLQFLDLVGLTFDQISLNFFKLIQINAKPYCAYGRPISFSSQAGPLASARPHAALPHAADKPDLPVSGTATLHCAGPPVRRLSPLSVSTRFRLELGLKSKSILTVRSVQN
jgi:hypothetical protein